MSLPVLKAELRQIPCISMLTRYMIVECLKSTTALSSGISLLTLSAVVLCIILSFGLKLTFLTTCFDITNSLE